MIDNGNAAVLIQDNIYIPKKYGVRVHNGDKILGYVIERKPTHLIMWAASVGTPDNVDYSEMIRIEIPISDVVAISEKGKDWEYL